MANPRNLANIAPNVNGSSGNVGIGSSAPVSKLSVAGSSSTDFKALTLRNSDGTTNSAAVLNFEASTGTEGDAGASAAQIKGVREGAGTNGALSFWTSNGGTSSERARFTSDGFFKASKAGTYENTSSHEFRTNQNAQIIYATSSLATTYTDALIQVSFRAQTPNSTGAWFLFCSDTTNQKAGILTTGTFESRTSTYGGVSDIKLKQDIVDASSQWNDLKAVRVRKFRFKDDANSPLQIGVIAQELEAVSPGLVYETPDKQEVQITNEDGSIQTKNVETGTTTKSVKYSILYMKAIKALQEAMDRIEQLEARLDAANL